MPRLLKRERSDERQRCLLRWRRRSKPNRIPSIAKRRRLAGGRRPGRLRRERLTDAGWKDWRYSVRLRPARPGGRAATMARSRCGRNRSPPLILPGWRGQSRLFLDRVCGPELACGLHANGVLQTGDFRDAFARRSFVYAFAQLAGPRGRRGMADWLHEIRITDVGGTGGCEV